MKLSECRYGLMGNSSVPQVAPPQTQRATQTIIKKPKVGNSIRKALDHPEVQERRRKFKALAYTALTQPRLRLVPNRSGWWCVLQRLGETRWIFQDGMTRDEIKNYFNLTLG
jgi:hypothetical protein